ncbi:MAG: erythromycin biosynthesis sensory transduction protein eryC1 [Verrucomicrobia bacterium]|nr:MAG: erythromycin biosynthesis sensory transduction protein eryC1 [Verrucomicrobiota bacterium]
MQVPYLDLRAQINSCRREIDAALAKAIDCCSFILGPDVLDFEKQFAKYCGVRHAIAVNSGTSALHLALLLLDVGPGDEIITTPYTFAASSWAISYVGARPVYVDINEATFNIDVTQVEKAITPRTKAILPVHLYGLPCDLEELLKIAARNSLPIIEDAAQAHGALYRGWKVGSFGKIACFSFYPAKNLGAFGEGGALLTDDSIFAERARLLREHGAAERYHHQEIGYNYRMEGLQGAVLRVKLNYLQTWTNARRQIAKRYSQLLADTPLRLPIEPEGSASAWHLYTVRHPQRDELKKFLEEGGIGSSVHYPLPLHLQPCYQFLDYNVGDFPIAERAAQECLSLPIYPELSDEQVAFVCSRIHGFFRNAP